ncbi:hypothetical protein [Photobacterium leiognathi]|uniref:hypothetical protein n=1 Tax=Photobacterium leiognathi TaxID=553611 RepID=UPI0027382FE5|nr:hypothetical protein [Photobacterium leiognathi]
MITCNIQFPNEHTDTLELPIPPTIGMTVHYLDDTFTIEEVILNGSIILLQMDGGKNKTQKKGRADGIKFERTN